MSEITPVAVAKAALRKAKQWPDRKNPTVDGSCVHFAGESLRASCLFGHALSMVGVTREQRARWMAASLYNVFASETHERCVPELRAIQEKADRDIRWGDLVRDLEEWLRWYGGGDE